MRVDRREPISPALTVMIFSLKASGSLGESAAASTDGQYRPSSKGVNISGRMNDRSVEHSI